MMSRATIFLFLSLIMLPTATAYESIFDVLEERFFDDDWSNVTSGGTPEKNVYWEGHIKCWIDITRFKNVSIIDGCEYVSGTPCDNVIIQYDAWHTFIHLWDLGLCFNDNVDHLLTDVRCFEDGGDVVAVLDVELMWHSTSADGDKDYVIETVTISTREIAPAVFNNTIKSTIAEITCYNNTFSPYTNIIVLTQDNIISTTFTYKNNTAKRFHSMGWITNNSNGNEHVEFLNKSFWLEDDDQNVIRHHGDQCIINEAPLNLSELQITISSPYTTKNVTDYNVTMINSKPSDYIQFKMIMILLIVIGVLTWGTINCARSAIHR